METNINICPDDCIVEINSNETVEKKNYITKSNSSNLYLQDLEYGNININNFNDINNKQSDESSYKYVKNFKPSTIFSLSVNFIRYIIGIYNYHGFSCFCFYFLVIFWIIFIR